MNKKISKNLTFHYTFKFRNGIQKNFTIYLDRETLNIIKPQKDNYPHWTELSCSKCPHCPLDEKKYTYCPIAANIVDLVVPFSNVISYEEADITIKTEDRTYSKTTAIQYGISSLIGIYMVTSGCPIMEMLKPMVRFHLPFATLEETTYRVLSMYLVAQFFCHKKEGHCDLDLKGLSKIYEDIRLLNTCFLGRLNKITIEDANLNALGILGTFANFIKFSIDEDLLMDIEKLFGAYINKIHDKNI